jgi:hypothetical protein
MSIVNEVAQTDHVVSLLPDGTGFCPYGLKQVKLPDVS